MVEIIRSKKKTISHALAVLGYRRSMLSGEYDTPEINVWEAIRAICGYLEIELVKDIGVVAIKKPIKMGKKSASNRR